MTEQSVKGWINNYLDKRGMSAPNGQPLYYYATRESERAFLAALLAMNMEERLSPIYRIYWAAGFCLFVADTYRSEYTAHWSWQAFDKELEVVLPPNERAELVKLGLSFWERPLRYQDQRADYLGSLFAEGGLPWPLLQSEQHGFGRAIKAGLSYRNTEKNTAAVIRQFEPYFPQAFRGDNTCQLLASIVDTLKRIANEYGLDKQSNPAAFLSEHAPQWREQFPLPLEEGNGVTLVNEWLADAGEQLGKHKHAHHMVHGFTCEHWLGGNLSSPQLEAQVWLESSLQIAMDGHSITNTRVELALYEGERLALKLGVDYGQVDGNLMTIRMPVETAMVSRQQPERPLMLVVFCSGQRLDTQVIQSSEIDWQHLPAVFIEDDSVTQLAGIASVQYQAAEALLRVPPDIQAPYAPALQTDDLGGHWYRINEKCVLEQGKDRYVIEPGEAANKMRVIWMGTMSSRSTLPVAGWEGWPRCQLLDAQGQTHLPEGFRVNGYLVNTLEGLPSAGRFQVDVLGQDQRVVARRKLGILPRDIAVSALPASSHAPARFIIRSVAALEVRVLNTELRSCVHQGAAEIRVDLEPGEQVPKLVQLDIRDGRSPQGMVLRLPYPEEGAQLLEPDGKPLEDTGLALKDVLGITLTLTPPPEVARTFSVCLELMGQNTHLERQYRYRVQSKMAEISLYSLYDDMLTLLSGSAEQDAYLRCRVETSQLHKQFYIYRYQASIRFTNQYHELFELIDHANNPLMHRSEGTAVMAMQLTNPESTPVKILPSAPNDIVTGFYELPKALHKDGPWLLYPDEHAFITFRPAIHVPDPAACQANDETEIKTLHAAAHYYHPLNYPEAFEKVFNAMSETFFHSGWQFMADLKSGYSHLPLSSLECWKQLVLNPEALALAVFRLELSPSFAERLTHELAVIWEMITVAQWQAAVRCYVEALAIELGLPESLLSNKAYDRMVLLKSQILVFKEFSKILCDPKKTLPSAPPLQVILPVWVNDLRALHDGDEWPVQLERSLNHWLQKQGSLGWLFNWLAERDIPDYIRAVVIMPVFSACLTAGNVRLDSLSAEDIERRFAFRVLSEFDRNTWYEPVYSAFLSDFLHARESYV